MAAWTPPNAEFPPPKTGEPPLHRAARLGNHSDIRRLISQGADINAIFDISLDPGAWPCPATPLMVAAGSGDGASADTVALLLELGADPKLVAGNRTAAMFAYRSLGWNYRPGGDAPRARLLHAAGSPLPSEPERLNQLLCKVAAVGDPDRLSCLLSEGANPKGYWNPQVAREEAIRFAGQMEACRASQPDLFKLMPAHLRAQIEESMRASERERFERENSAPNSMDIPLFEAASSGSAECVRLLLDAGADPTIRDNAKQTAIYFATSLPVVRTLQAAGLSTEDSNEFSASPLRCALYEGIDGLPKVRALIGAGANVNAVDAHGYTVFMSAVGSGRNLEVLRYLVASGANPLSISNFGYNAFHAAVDVDGAGSPECVRSTFAYLKELGVDLEHRNQSGETPLARAVHQGSGIEVAALCELGANASSICPWRDCGGDECITVDLPLLFHAIHSRVDQDVNIESLLRAGADPRAQNAGGFTPVHLLVAKLCSNATDYPSAWQAFFEGLCKLTWARSEAPMKRDEFIAAAVPTIREFVEPFAAQIPIPQFCQFDQQWRRALVASIVQLCAYEAWARIHG